MAFQINLYILSQLFYKDKDLEVKCHGMAGTRPENERVVPNSCSVPFLLLPCPAMLATDPYCDSPRHVFCQRISWLLSAGLQFLQLSRQSFVFMYFGCRLDKCYFRNQDKMYNIPARYISALVLGQLILIPCLKPIPILFFPSVWFDCTCFLYTFLCHLLQET